MQPDDDGAWRDRAACKGAPIEIFYAPPSGDKGGNSPGNGSSYYTQARAICSSCEVVRECLEDVARTGDTWGFRGGMSPKELARFAGRRHWARTVCSACGKEVTMGPSTVGNSLCGRCTGARRRSTTRSFGPCRKCGSVGTFPSLLLGDLCSNCVSDVHAAIGGHH